MASDAPQAKPVLILSSNDALMRAVQRALQPVGFQLMASQRPREFLLSLKRAPWDLILVDTSLAGTSRADLVRAVRTVDHGVPMIVFVPQNDLPFCVDALQLGADDVLTIPLQTVELKFRVAGRYGKRHAPHPSESERSEASRSHELGLLHELDGFHQFCLQQFIALEKRALELKERLDEVSGVTRTVSGNIGQLLLVVHSDPDVGAVLQELGQSINIVVRQVFTGGEALDLAGQSSIDLLICEDELPDIAGEMVVSSLKSEYPYLDTIMITGWGTPEGQGTLFDEVDDETVTLDARNTDDLEGLLQGFINRRSRREVRKRLAVVFKDKHRDFMRRYAQVKLRMRQALNRQS